MGKHLPLGTLRGEAYNKDKDSPGHICTCILQLHVSMRFFSGIIYPLGVRYHDGSIGRHSMLFPPGEL